MRVVNKFLSSNKSFSVKTEIKSHHLFLFAYVL